MSLTAGSLLAAGTRLCQRAEAPLWGQTQQRACNKCLDTCFQIAQTDGTEQLSYTKPRDYYTKLPLAFVHLQPDAFVHVAD